jgi:hypothetical protein
MQADPTPRELLATHPVYPSDGSDAARERYHRLAKEREQLEDEVVYARVKGRRLERLDGEHWCSDADDPRHEAWRRAVWGHVRELDGEARGGRRKLAPSEDPSDTTHAQRFELVERLQRATRAIELLRHLPVTDPATADEQAPDDEPSECDHGNVATGCPLCLVGDKPASATYAPGDPGPIPF